MRQKLVLLVVLLLSIVHVHSEEWIPAVNPLTSCNESYYQLDRALIRYQADPQQKLLLYAINNQCYKCIRSYVGSGTNDSNSCATLWTPHSWDLYLVDSSTDSIVAQVQYSFGEKGEYLLSPLPINRDITNADLVENDFSIEILETKKPVDGLFPLIIFIIVLIVIAILSFVLPFFYETFFSGSNDDSVDKSENGRAQVRIFSNPVETFEPLVANSTENYSRVPLLEEGGTMERNLSTVSGPTRTTSATPNNGVTGKNKQTSPVKKERLKSLDTFRGLSLLLMIFVNYGGGGYWFLDHSPWNGLTVADLLFPWFMWIMGVSMAMSFASQLPKGDFYHVGAGSIVVHRPSLMVPWVMWYRVCRRSFILFGLGMFLANGYEYTTWRVPGVLQYFAISYFITSATVLIFHETTQRRIHIVLDQEIQRNEYNKDSGCSVFDRILACRKSAILTAYCYEWIVQLAIIAIYIGIAYGVSAPGCPRGYIGPGGLGDDGEHPDCTGGIHRYIDMQIFGYKLIYHHPTCLNLYKCIAYDPEGLLGSLTACTLTYLGLMSGRIILHFKEHKERLVRWWIWAAVLLLLTGILCGFSQNEGVMPVNKNLWSTSFAFVTAGGGLIGLSICYIIIDIYKVWTGAPFIYLGMNSILIYCGHSLLADYMPFSYEIHKETHANMLTVNVIGVFSWVLIAYYCYINKFFIKI